MPASLTLTLQGGGLQLCSLTDPRPLIPEAIFELMVFFRLQEPVL